MGTATELIGKEEFTLERLEAIYRAAYMNPETNAQVGMVRVDIDGAHVLATADPGRGLLRLQSLFKLKPEARREQMLELCNRINDGLIMIRATCPAGFPNPTLLLDHYTITDAGVTGPEVVEETRRFGRVVRDVMPLDTESILV